MTEELGKPKEPRSIDYKSMSDQELLEVLHWITYTKGGPFVIQGIKQQQQHNTRMGGSNKTHYPFRECITRVRWKNETVTLDFLMIQDNKAYVNVHEEYSRDDAGKLFRRKNDLIAEHALIRWTVWRDLVAHGSEYPKEWKRVIDKEFIERWSK